MRISSSSHSALIMEITTVQKARFQSYQCAQTASHWHIQSFLIYISIISFQTIQRFCRCFSLMPAVFFALIFSVFRFVAALARHAILFVGIIFSSIKVHLGASFNATSTDGCLMNLAIGPEPSHSQIWRRCFTSNQMSRMRIFLYTVSNYLQDSIFNLHIHKQLLTGVFNPLMRGANFFMKHTL